MRKIIVSEFVTLDGIMEAPDKWSFSYWNEEIAKFKLDELSASDALLLGRVTYEGFAAAWPNMTETEGEYGNMMNGYAKFVASKTLGKAEWNNSTVIRKDILEEVSRLKQQPGKDILVFGSCELANSLMRHNLIDEYRLLVYPIVIGGGKPLFKDIKDRLNLKLVKTKTFGSGVVLLTYEPAKK